MISLKLSGVDNITIVAHAIVNIMYRYIFRASIVTVLSGRGLALTGAAALIFYRKRLIPLIQ